MHEIRDAMTKGAKTLKDIQAMTEACTGSNCSELNPSGKCCSGDINAILNGNLKPLNRCCCCG